MAQIPDNQTLVELYNSGFSYREVADRFGVSYETIRQRLVKAGLVDTTRRPNPEKNIGTALYLIAAGVTTYRRLAEHLDYNSPTSAFRLVQRLIKAGLVTSQPNRSATLQLTQAGRQAIINFKLVTRRADGVLTPFVPGRKKEEGAE